MMDVVALALKTMTNPKETNKKVRKRKRKSGLPLFAAVILFPPVRLTYFWLYTSS
jgi:hypothetical protein